MNLFIISVRINKKFGINEKEMDKSTVLKLINIRYQIWLNSYQKYISTTIASDVSDQTVLILWKNSDSLQGVTLKKNPYADIQTVNVLQILSDIPVRSRRKSMML